MNQKLKQTAIGTAVAAAAAAGVPAAAVLKPGTDIVQFLWSRATDARRKAMLDELVARFAELNGYDDRMADEGLHRLLTDSTQEQEDLIYESFKSMAFGKSRWAWPYMARLTADYLVHRDGTSDSFFKRAAWLLERCESEDIAFLKGAFSVTRGSLVAFRGEYGDVASAFEGYEWVPNPGQLLVVSLSPQDEERSPMQRFEHDLGIDRNEDVVALLLESRLARRTPIGAVFCFECLDRLLDLFRV